MRKSSLKKRALLLVLVFSLIITVSACSTKAYTVSFNTDGGGSVASQSVEKGRKAVKPEKDPAKTGYRFGGWYKDTGKTDPFDFAEEVIESDVTVYARFTPNNYSVAYDKNGGTGNNMANSPHTYDSAKSLTVNTYARAGYTFGGWNTAADGSGTSYADGQSVINLTAENNAAVTLYAIWQAESQADGTEGKYCGVGVWEEGSVKYWGIEIILDGEGKAVVSVMAGNEKDGSDWQDATALIGDVVLTYTVEGNIITVYADGEIFVWGTIDAYGNILGVKLFEITVDLIKEGNEQPVIETYEVTFDTDGGNEIALQTVNEGGKAVRPAADPVKEGYTFGGWYKDAAMTELFDFDSEIINGDTVIYAKWTENTYTVSFDTDGGSETALQNVSEGGKAVRPAADPERTGYTFVNWYKADKTTLFDFDSEVISGDTVIYAKWTANTYTVAYNRNGASGSTASTTHTYDIESSITSTSNPARSGYTFLGWCLDQNGEGTLYQRGDMVLNLTSVNGATVTMYAQWKINQINVTYNANGGSGTMEQEAYEYNSLWTPSACVFVRDGYYFIGYTTTATGSTWRYPGTEYTMGTTAVNLYARWAENVSFNTDGGSAVAGQPVIIGGTAARPAANPTKAGYTFDNWYADAAKTILFDFENTVITGQTVIYARWIPNSFTVAYNANGSAAAMPSSSHFNGDGSSLSASTLTRNGYIFAGWNTMADGSGTNYFDCAFIDYVAASDGAVFEIYAHWVESAKTYTAVADITVQDAISAAAANLPVLQAQGPVKEGAPRPSDALTAYGITELNYLYKGEVFTGVWQAKVPVSILTAGLVLELYGNGKGYIAMGTTDFGELDYAIIGNTIYILYHLNIANSNQDSYSAMGTLTINADGSLYADMYVSGNAVKAALPAANIVKGITVYSDGTGYLSVVKGIIESKVFFRAAEGTDGVYTLSHSLPVTDGDNTITYKIVDGKIILSYKHALKGSSTVGTITSVYTCVPEADPVTEQYEVTFDTDGVSGAAF